MFHYINKISVSLVGSQFSWPILTYIQKNPSSNLPGCPPWFFIWDPRPYQCPKLNLYLPQGSIVPWPWQGPKPGFQDPAGKCPNLHPKCWDIINTQIAWKPKSAKKNILPPNRQHLLTDHASLGHRRLFLVTEGLGNAAGHVGQEATKLLHHDMSGWWLNQRIWNILVKLEIFPT